MLFDHQVIDCSTITFRRRRCTMMLFRRTYRMSRPLFLRIIEAVESYDNYFTQKRDAADMVGLSSLQKVTAAFQMLAYGLPAHLVIEKSKIKKLILRFEIH